MYAVFNKKDDFMGFVRRIPDVPVENYFLYELEEEVDYSIHSAYLVEEGVKLYCDGRKVLETIADMGLVKRIIGSINKFGDMI